MPELPEVETVRRGLSPVMEGATIARADVRRPDLRWPLPDRMAERLAGVTIHRLRRRSKYILADLSSGETLIVHLGMSGRILISGTPQGLFHHAQSAPDAHDHVVLSLQSGAQIVFNDPRRFGAMDLVATDQTEEHWLLAKLGPEPLGNAFNDNYLYQAFRGKRSPVKSVLLDQRIVAGLGNIYVCEALFRARIHPARHAGRIGRTRVERLVPVIRGVLNEAIEAGGSSLQDYRQADGNLGYFQHNFAVYGREGEACLTPGCGAVVRRLVQSGRSTFYCPKCQR